MSIQYLINENGEKTGVLLDMKQWNYIVEQLGLDKEASMNEDNIIESIEQAVKEMNMVNKGELKARPIKELLDEL